LGQLNLNREDTESTKRRHEGNPFFDRGMEKSGKGFRGETRGCAGNFLGVNPRIVKLSQADLSYRIIAAAIEVHRKLGPGLLESVYRTCMVHELNLRSIQVRD